MANRKRTRTQKRQRKRRGGTTRKKLTKPTFGDLDLSPDTSVESQASSPGRMSSAEIDQLIRELPSPKYGRPRSTRRLPNIHCDEKIQKEKLLCKDSIKNAMQFASNECSKEIEENNQQWENRIKEYKRNPPKRQNHYSKRPPNAKKPWKL
jgi:hypothetical protein